jgi:hypothetical protein
VKSTTLFLAAALPMTCLAADIPSQKPHSVKPLVTGGPEKETSEVAEIRPPAETAMSWQPLGEIVRSEVLADCGKSPLHTACPGAKLRPSAWR